MRISRGAWGPWAAVAVAAVVPFALWLMFRVAYVASVGGLPTFLGACTRMADAGLTPLPTDQICFESFWGAYRLNLSWATYVQASGFMLAGLILVASGRRWSALLVPAALLIGDSRQLARSTFGSYPPEWVEDDLVSWGIVAVAVLLPVVVAIRVLPRRERPKVTARAWAWMLSLSLIVVATIALDYLFIVSLRSVGALRFIYDEVYIDYPYLDWLVSVGSVAGVMVFGLLIGRDRRFWPWAIGLVALLMCAGPTSLLTRPIESPGQLRTTAHFGAVIPLFLLGVLWSLLPDLVARLDRHAWRDEVASAPPNGWARATLVLNVSLAVVLVGSVMAYRNDPYPRDMPLYLGYREAANDVAIRMEMWDALEALREYRRQHGTFEGFRAADGARIDPTVRWSDLAVPAGHSEYWTGVVPVRLREDEVTLLGGSSSDAAFCLRAVGARVAYGRSGEGEPPAKSAMRHCDDMPWTDPSEDAPDYPKCDVSDGYLICRMVTVMMHNILAPREPQEAFGYAWGDRWATDVPVDWTVREGSSLGHPSVTIQSGGRNGVSTTVTDLGEARDKHRPCREFGCLAFAADQVFVGRSDVDLSVTWRAELDGRAYRVTIRAGRLADSEVRQRLLNVVTGIRTLEPPEGRQL